MIRVIVFIGACLLMSGAASVQAEQTTRSSTNSAETYQRASDLFNKGQYAEALLLYQYLAEQGYADAQSDLGYMYERGLGVTQNESQAVYWIWKAVEQGNAGAQNNLGVIYANGQGLAQNDNQAVYWIRKAAEQSYADAQSNLGVMYEKGLGVTKDRTQAIYWYRKAADQGSQKAMAALNKLSR